MKSLSFNDLPWLKHFFMLNKKAAVYLTEYVYGGRRFRNQPWETFKKSMSLDFVRHILPTFGELQDLSPHDLGQIMHSHNSGIAHFFRISFWIDIGSSAQMITCSVASKEDYRLLNWSIIIVIFFR